MHILPSRHRIAFSDAFGIAWVAAWATSLLNVLLHGVDILFFGGVEFTLLWYLLLTTISLGVYYQCALLLPYTVLWLAWLSCRFVRHDAIAASWIVLSHTAISYYSTLLIIPFGPRNPWLQLTIGTVIGSAGFLLWRYVCRYRLAISSELEDGKVLFFPSWLTAPKDKRQLQ